MPSISIPRICEQCNKPFVRRGRAKKCEECQPPGAKTERAPRGVISATAQKRADLEYAQEFIGGVLLMGGTSLIGINEHDAAVVLRAARTLPPQLAQVMSSSDAAAEAFINLSKKGSVIYLGATVILTVLGPILANHGIGPKKMRLSDDAVTKTIEQSMAILNRAGTVEKDDVTVDDDPANGLDLSFMAPSENAA